MPASKLTPEIERIIIELYSGTHPDYLNKKFGAEAISDILLEKHGIVYSRSPVGKQIKRLIASGELTEVFAIEKQGSIDQRSPDYGQPKKNYNVIRPITSSNKRQFPNLYPKDANFSTLVNKDKKLQTIYTSTEAEAQRIIDETKFVPKGPTDAKRQRYINRKTNEEIISKGSSEADKVNIKTIKGGIKKLNKYFKNSPELINTTDFGKNIKSMLALRADKDTGNIYSKLEPDSYYKTKAQQGQLFDLFDINPVAGKKAGGRFATNVNISPNLFNRVFVGSQITTLFNKGVNEETANQLDTILKEKNLRIDLPNVGKIGAKPGVSFDSVTGRFPQIEKTIESLGGTQEIKNFFVQEATVPGSPICNLPSVAKRKADGGRIAFANGSNCAIEVGEAFDKNPKGFAQEVNKLPEESGAFNRVKSAASKFLSVAKKGGRFGAFAAVGAAGAGLVKEFTSDDPTSYLSCLLYTSPSPRD